MAFRNRLVLSTCLILLVVAGSLFAQGTTGTITGTVTQDGTPLPGVSVSVTSSSMQGVRNTVSNDAGGYNFGALPPGEYTVSFELTGLQSVTRRQHVGVAQNTRVDADLKVSAVSEAITVTASAPAVAETQEVQTNFTGKTIENLPVGRTITAITSLAPGVSSNGVNGLSISGGMSYDNLYTVNGAVIQENLRGQPHNLFIEDSIQETTIHTGAISAEYGNFTGGVVNSITKSGGNEFSGSLRDSLTNPKWTTKSPSVYAATGSTVREVATPEPTDIVNSVYEATLGGRILRDRLWFFTAGRYSKRDSDRTFTNAGGTFVRSSLDERMEAKLTGAITARHNLVFSYLDAPSEATNDCQIGCFDSTQLDPSVTNPNAFITGFYNGVLTNNLLVEGTYTKKTFAFQGYGGESSDRVTGTPVRLTAPGYATIVNEPFFCGSCGDEARDNGSLGLKATYFLGTGSMGSHNIVAGVARWHEERLSNNYQSSSLFVFRARTIAPKRGSDGLALVSIRGGNDYVEYWPILNASLGSDLNTDSLYVNDRWDFGSHWQFNLGARYDKNDSSDSMNQAVSNDSMISPRLGATYDTFGNGRLTLRAGYGVYVGRLAETVSGSGSSAGNPAFFAYLYEGPDILDQPAEEAMRRVWAWFDSIGGYEKAALIGQNIPGASRRIEGALKSPNVAEYTLGVSTALSRGFIRADYIDRSWRDFYDLATNLQTGQITLPNGSKADLGLVVNNEDFLERSYRAVEIQSQYRPLTRLNLGLNYTWSRLDANLAGESSGGGPGVFGSVGMYYPEYYNWPGGENSPVGPSDLEDQTHKARAFASFDIPTPIGNFNLALLQRYESGLSYGLFGSIDVRFSQNFYGTNQPGGIVNPGYVSPPTAVTYWFEKPGSRRYDPFTATDLSLNYDSRPGWLRGASFFVQGELINALNESSELTTNRSILTASNDATLKRFNPMIGEQPIEGVHYRKGPLFGLPTAATSADVNGSFQLPRTYRVSLGLRF